MVEISLSVAGEGLGVRNRPGLLDHPRRSLFPLTPRLRQEAGY